MLNDYFTEKIQRLTLEIIGFDYRGNQYSLSFVAFSIQQVSNARIKTEFFPIYQWIVWNRKLLFKTKMEKT